MSQASVIASQDARAERAVSIGLGGLMLSIVLCFGVGLTKYIALVNLLYPILCLAIAGWFLAFVPQYYISFSLWLYILTPFVRRIVDYKIGVYSDDPVIMIAPFLVSGLAILSIARHWRNLSHKAFKPALICLVACTYGLIVTVGYGAPVPAVKEYLGWAGPIMMGIVVLIHWDDYPKFRSAVGKTMSWALVVTGIYGLIQYFIFPPWDDLWMRGAEITSLGAPEALKVRVYSMLNSAGPFGMIVVTALLMQFAEKGPVSRIGIFVGVIGAMLSNVRSAWLGFIVGVLIAFVRSDGLLKRRLLITILVAIFVGGPLFLRSPLSKPITDRVNDRIDSMENIEDDGSFQARASLYLHTPALVMGAPLGRGFASTAYDSAWVTMLTQLGVIAGIAYIYGFVTFILTLVRLRLRDSDHFGMLALANSLSLAALMVSGNLQIVPVGAFLWTMCALALASSFYVSTSTSVGSGQTLAGDKAEIDRLIS